MRYAILFCIALVIPACASVEVCYSHPKYGEVCVMLGGKEFKRSDLTAEQAVEVDLWLKTEKAKAKLPVPHRAVNDGSP